jgi:hypothetical protein
VSADPSASVAAMMTRPMSMPIRAPSSMGHVQTLKYFELDAEGMVFEER